MFGVMQDLTIFQNAGYGMKAKKTGGKRYSCCWRDKNFSVKKRDTGWRGTRKS